MDWMDKFARFKHFLHTIFRKPRKMVAFYLVHIIEELTPKTIFSRMSICQGVIGTENNLARFMMLISIDELECSLSCPFELSK